MKLNPAQIEQTAAANIAARGKSREPSGPAAAPLFRQALSQVANNKVPQAVTVKAGDTLMSLTRHYLGSSVSQFSSSQIYDMAKTVARDNGIKNPDRIMPGQSLNMANLAPTSTLSALKLRQPTVEQIQKNTAVQASHTPVLDKTLARAVSKGYVSTYDQAAVRDKVLSMASRHNFAPDDFAKLTLMESDGMNPRASNGNCHGIIQFCDGSNRGAASAGYGNNPKAILSMSVLQQLDLVNNYFDDTGLKGRGLASLDELYLTVLTPAARTETNVDAPLNINGRQSAYLYEGRDQSGNITRNSIVTGLKQNARDRLGEYVGTLARADIGPR